MRDTGIEPVTSSVSGKRATAAPIALMLPGERAWWEPRWRRDSNPRRRLCRPLPNHSATPPGTRSLEDKVSGLDQGRKLRADDGSRTRDPHHGKVMLYQLSYNRESSAFRLTFDRKLYHSLFRAHARRLGCGQCVQSDAQGSRSASFGLLAVPTGVDIRPPGSRHANRLQCPGPTGVQDSSHVTGGLGVCMSEAQAPDRYCLRERAKGDSRGATRCRRGRIGEPRQGALWFPGRKARLAQR